MINMEEVKANAQEWLIKEYDLKTLLYEEHEVKSWLHKIAEYLWSII